MHSNINVIIIDYDTGASTFYTCSSDVENIKLRCNSETDADEPASVGSLVPHPFLLAFSSIVLDQYASLNI